MTSRHATRIGRAVSKTPLRAIRVDDELWTEAQEVADRNGESLSEVLRQALRDYIKEAGPSRTATHLP